MQNALDHGALLTLKECLRREFLGHRGQLNSLLPCYAGHDSSCAADRNRTHWWDGEEPAGAGPRETPPRGDGLQRRAALIAAVAELVSCSGSVS